MLVITRKADESIIIGDNITITILDTGNSVRVGIEAPSDISIHREEIYQRIAGTGTRQGFAVTADSASEQ